MILIFDSYAVTPSSVQFFNFYLSKWLTLKKKQNQLKFLAKQVTIKKDLTPKTSTVLDI